jgi:hypothetical protein
MAGASRCSGSIKGCLAEEDESSETKKDLRVAMMMMMMIMMMVMMMMRAVGSGTNLYVNNE